MNNKLMLTLNKYLTPIMLHPSRLEGGRGGIVIASFTSLELFGATSIFVEYITQIIFFSEIMWKKFFPVIWTIRFICYNLTQLKL